MFGAGDVNINRDIKFDVNILRGSGRNKFLFYETNKTILPRNIGWYITNYIVREQ